MIVQPGGKVEFELCDSESCNLKVTPPKTGVTVNERPLGRRQTVFRIVTEQLGSFSSKCEEGCLELRREKVDARDRLALLFYFAPHLRGEWSNNAPMAFPSSRIWLLEPVVRPEAVTDSSDGGRGRG